MHLPDHSVQASAHALLWDERLTVSACGIGAAAELATALTPAVSRWAAQKKVWLPTYGILLRQTYPLPQPACLLGGASPSCCTSSGDFGACLHRFGRACAVCAAAGVFPFRTSMSRRGGRTGYVEVEARQGCLFPAGCKLRGHICHSSEILQVGSCLMLGSTFGV